MYMLPGGLMGRCVGGNGEMWGRWAVAMVQIAVHRAIVFATPSLLPTPSVHHARWAWGWKEGLGKLHVPDPLEGIARDGIAEDLSVTEKERRGCMHASARRLWISGWMLEYGICS